MALSTAILSIALLISLFWFLFRPVSIVYHSWRNGKKKYEFNHSIEDLRSMSQEDLSSRAGYFLN